VLPRAGCQRVERRPTHPPRTDHQSDRVSERISGADRGDDQLIEVVTGVIQDDDRAHALGRARDEVLVERRAARDMRTQLRPAACRDAVVLDDPDVVALGQQARDQPLARRRGGAQEQQPHGVTRRP
jgi:hypothetical protein